MLRVGKAPRGAAQASVGWRAIPLAALACACACLLALAACAGNSGGSTAGGNTSGGSDAKAHSILQHARAAKLDNALVSSTELVTVAGVTTTALSVGAATFAPDQADLTTSVRVGSQPVLASHEILTNNTLYVRPANASTWHAYPIAAAAAVTSNPVGAWVQAQYFSPSHFLALTNARYVGTETLNGVSVYHLRGTGSTVVQVPQRTSSPGATSHSATYTEDLYLRTDTYQPARVDTVARASFGTIEWTTDFSRWNAGVTIAAPPSGSVSDAAA